MKVFIIVSVIAVTTFLLASCQQEVGSGHSKPVGNDSTDITALIILDTTYVPMPAQQTGKGIGHFLGAMRIDAFRPAEDFKKDMDHWIQGFRKCRTIPGEEKVLVPGDPEKEFEEERSKNGIPLLDAVVDDLKNLADKFFISLLLS